MAKPTVVTLSDDSILAEYVNLEDFKGILEQRVAVGPDLLACLIRDGQIAEASAGGHFAIGGVWRTLKDAVAGQHAIRLLLADLKPFQLTTAASSLSRDNVPIVCEFVIELQVNPERPANILGMTPSHGILTKSSVLERLAPHLGERVLNAAVRQVDALDMRGNNGLQDKVQADAMREVERIAGDIGLMARVVSVNWGFNEEEKAQIEKRQHEREQEAIERDYQILNRSIQREAESTILKLTTDKDIEAAKVSTEDDLRRMILSNELNFVDARETGLRIQQLKQLEHELQLNRTQRLDGLKAQLETEDHRIDMARSAAQRRGVELDQVITERRHDVDVARVTTERRAVEMELDTQERQHSLTAQKIQADIREVQRAIEEADARQRLNLQKLEEIQKLDIAARAHEDQIKTLRDVQQVDLEAEEARLGFEIKASDAKHRRTIEASKLESDSQIEKIKALRDASPEQIMAIQAGFSPQVADVMIQQARAQATDSQAQMALMREMIQQAQAAKVASEEQARHLFDSGMQGTVGVAQGVGLGVGAGAAGGGGRMHQQPGLEVMDGNTECPNCHRVIPTNERFCRYCGRQMRQ